MQREETMKDVSVRLVIALLVDMLMTPSPASNWTLKLVQRWHHLEVHAIAELFAPGHREWIAKERSNHWSKLLFSSRDYFDCSMKELFRMNSSSIASLHKALCRRMIPIRDAPAAGIPPKRLAIFLYVCAQGSTVRDAAGRFAVGPATVSEIVKEVAAVVCQELHGLISFPPFRSSASHFADSCGIPQIAGCIDGSHIPISKPSKNGEMYYNRKCLYSVALQAVVDWRGRFCDLDCKWPGRVGDSRVFRNSALAQSFPPISLVSSTVTLPTGVDTFVRIPYFLLGDSGYQNNDFMVTTFEIAEMQDAICSSLNKRLSHARYRVECAFGQLKCRWRILLKGIGQDISVVPDIVYALCIIQNFLMDHNDVYTISECEKRRILESYETRFPQPETVGEDSTSETIHEKLKRWRVFRHR